MAQRSGFSIMLLLALCFLMALETSSLADVLKYNSVLDLPAQNSRLPAASSSSSPDGAHVEYEQGVFVETLLDGNKLNLSIHNTFASPSEDYLYAIDSTASQILKIHMPIDQSSGKRVARRIAGDGQGRTGYKDGWGADALFDHPKGLTVDGDGNVYVADVRNGAIRMITPSGYVSTIAGQSNKSGHADGEGRNACFSSDFDLTYVPENCTLLVSDRGNRRLRSILLQPMDICSKRKGDSAYHWSIVTDLLVAINIIVTIVVAMGIVLVQKWQLQRVVADPPLALEEGNGGFPSDGNVNGQLSDEPPPDQIVSTRPLLTNPATHLQRGRSLPHNVAPVNYLNEGDLMDFCSDCTFEEREQGGQECSDCTFEEREQGGQECKLQLESSIADSLGDIDANVAGQDDDGSPTPMRARIMSLEDDLCSGSSRTAPGASSACNVPNNSVVDAPDKRLSADECLQRFDRESSGK